LNSRLEEAQDLKLLQGLGEGAGAEGDDYVLSGGGQGVQADPVVSPADPVTVKLKG
jgi:hypothetical protein